MGLPPITSDMPKISCLSFCCDNAVGKAKEIKSRDNVKTVFILFSAYHLEVGATAYMSAA